MALEQLLYVLLVFGQQRAFLAVVAVVTGFSEVGDELVPDGNPVFIGHVVQQVFESPCHTQLPGTLEVRARGGIGRDEFRVDDAQGRVSGGAVRCNQVAQTF